MRGPSISVWGDRGQTNIDFLVGMVVFLVTVAFVFVSSASLVTPFADDRATPLVADRVADDVVGTQLAAPGEPGALDGDCTVAFFGGPGASGCAFDASASLQDRLGVDGTDDLNVTVQRNDGVDGPVLCADASGDPQSCSAGGTRLAAGGSPPVGSDAVVTASRIVHVDGTDVVVVVRVW